MYNTNIPDKQEIPSTKQLIKSTIWAAVVAVVLLICVVMPAEYGIDPTGIGQVLGLKRMGEIKKSLAEESASDHAAAEQTDDQGDEWAITIPGGEGISDESGTVLSNQQQVELAPDQAVEIKLTMQEGATVQYEWWTDGGAVIYDVHGNSKEHEISYHNYSKGTDERVKDSLVAAFDGSHGWYWRNRTAETVNITLKIEGEYTDIKHYK